MLTGCIHSSWDYKHRICVTPVYSRRTGHSTGLCSGRHNTSHDLCNETTGLQVAVRGLPFLYTQSTSIRLPASLLTNSYAYLLFHHHHHHHHQTLMVHIRSFTVSRLREFVLSLTTFLCQIHQSVSQSVSEIPPPVLKDTFHIIKINPTELGSAWEASSSSATQLSAFMETDGAPKGSLRLE